MHVNPLIPALVPLVIALIALGFTFWIWRDHHSLTSAEVGKALKADSRKRDKLVMDSLEEFDTRYQTLRREFTRLSTEVNDILEDAQRTMHRATMRERRAKETQARNDARGDGAAQLTPEQAWEMEKKQRLAGQWGPRRG